MFDNGIVNMTPLKRQKIYLTFLYKIIRISPEMHKIYYYPSRS